MFTTKIFKLAYAITIAEGWITPNQSGGYPQGSASYRNHNPGNVRSSTYEISNTGGFSQFASDLEGFYAVVHQLYLYASGRSQTVPNTSTIAQAISHYNGLQETDAEFAGYIDIIEKVGGVNRTDLIKSIIL